MRGVLLFTVAAAGESFDDRLEELLSMDQANHSAAYHLERIHVRVGAQAESLEPSKLLAWNVCTDARGELLNPRASADVTHQLSTYLYGKIVENHDEGCSAVFVSSGNAAAGVALLQLSRLVANQLLKLFPIKTHIFLLQNQYAFRDPGVTWLMRRIRECSEMQPAFYTSMYMLPWDNGDVQESSRLTIAALVKTMMVARVDPMPLQGISQPHWIETAAMRKLIAPVERITNVVFKYLTDGFANQVLYPAIHSEEVLPSQPKNLQDCVRNLEGFVSEVERRNMLPPFEEMLCIMPVRDPAPVRKLDEDISTEKAWDAVYAIYGNEKGTELKNRLSPSLDQLEEQYRQIGRQLSVELLRSVISLARSNNQNLMIRQLLAQIGERLLARMKDRDAGPAELPKYDNPLFDRDRKDAISKARQRHFYLWKVYRAATRRLSDERRRLRGEMIQNAIFQAQQYLRDCLTRLEANYRQMCAIFLSRPVERSCYIDRLEAAYEYWCSHAEAIHYPDVDELYELFDDEVLGMDIESAASTICSRLEQLIKQHTKEAVDTIRVTIGSFFSELSFRSAQLTQQGMNGNMNESLLDYLNNQEFHSPLLYRKTAGDAMRIRAQALIFYSEDAGNADAFSRLAKQNGVEVVNDPHEKGVQMIVKYAGEALEDVLVYISNMEEGEGES